MAPRTSIVILGGGFGGAHVAMELGRLGRQNPPWDVTIVDERNFLIYTPMLTEVVGGQVDPRHIAWATRKLAPALQFVQGRVTAVDLHTRTVTVCAGDPAENVPQATRTLQADQLVIGLGSTSQFHHIPGLEQHALTVKSVGDAGRIRNRALALLDRAAVEPDGSVREALLTFVVGGGGFSGVETMAALNDLVRDASAYYPAVERGSIRMLLCHHGDRLLPELGPRLAAYAQRALERRGVEVRLGTSVTGAGEDYVELNHQERISTRLLVWTGGVTPSPIVQKLDCAHGRHGGLLVDGCCALAGHDGVWALGDCAEVPTANGGSYAPTAQNAVREGKLVAHNIAARLQGQAPRPFAYQAVGELALVGKRTGVASVYGLQFSGVLAWAMWRLIYLVKMPGRTKQVKILFDWLMDLAFGLDISDLPAVHGYCPATSHPDAQPAASRSRTTEPAGVSTRPTAAE